MSIAGPIAGQGGLTKTGSGTLTLSANSSYGGATIISGGTLRLGDPGLPSVPAVPTAVYTFTNASGSTVPNGANPGTYDGTLQNGAAVTVFPGSPNGYALSLGTQGGNAYLQVAGSNNNGIPSSTGTYTASAWFYGLYGPGYWRTLFHGPDPGYYGDHQVIIDAGSNNLGFYGNAAGGGFTSSGYSMASYNGATAWNQLTVVASGGTSTYYIDGQEVGTLAKVSTTGIFAIGNWQGGAQVFSQYLDNVYIYNDTALDAAGVMQLYRATTHAGGGLPSTTALSIAANATLDLGGESQQVASLSDYAPGNGGSIINSNSGTSSVLTLSPTGASTTFTGSIMGGGTLGTISLVMNGSGTQVLCGSNTYTGPTTISAGTLQIGDGTNGHDGSLTTSGIANNAALVYDVAVGQAAAYPISGAGSLTKAGAGTLTLSGSNSYTGSTFLTGGIIALNTGLPGSSLVMSGSTTLDLSGASGGLVSLGSLADAAGSPTGHQVLLGGNTLETGLDNSSTAFSGTISGSGGLVKSGSGTFTLAGTNTYSGGTSLQAGTLSIGSDGNIGGPGSTINFQGGILQVTGSAITNLDSHTVNWGSFNGGIDVADAGNSLTISQAISGSGSLTKAGPGLLVLSGSNSYTGNTFLTGGSIALNTGLPSSSAVMSSNTTLDLSSASGGLVSLGSLADAAGSPTGHQVLLGDNTLATGLDNSSTAFSGTISGSGGLVKSGSGTFTLAGTNTYYGGTSLQAGTLSIGSDGNIGGPGSTINFRAASCKSRATRSRTSTAIRSTGVPSTAVSTSPTPVTALPSARRSAAAAAWQRSDPACSCSVAATATWAARRSTAAC